MLAARLGEVLSWEQLPVLLDTADMARLYRVDHKTISRWAKSGQIPPPTLNSGNVCRWAREVVREHLVRRQRHSR